MASQELTQRIQEQIDLYRSLDQSKILRPELGVESLEKIFSEVLNDISSRIDVVNKVAAFVSDNSIQSVITHLQNINSQLSTLSNFPNQEYISRKSDVVRNVRSYLDAIKDLWPIFFTASQEKFPQNAAPQEAEKIISELNIKLSEADQRLANFNNSLEEANNIREAAQNTAQKVSIKGAQDQFGKAKTNLYWKIGLTSIGVAGSLIWFFILAFNYQAEINLLNDTWTWKIGYHASIRAVILGAVGAISTFFITMLKAYLHLLEHNLHKQRVANSTEAFIAAAISPEYKDVILEQLVSSVTNFGESGILKRESSENSPISKIN